jgi:hypothetical protein
MMTPAQHRRNSVADSEETGPKSIKTGSENNTNFVAATFSRLKKKAGERDDSPSMHSGNGNGYANGQSDEAASDEAMTTKRSKALKKILGGLN